MLDQKNQVYYCAWECEILKLLLIFLFSYKEVIKINMNKESGSVKTEDKESGYQEKNLGNLLSKLDEKILILEMK